MLEIVVSACIEGDRAMMIAIRVPTGLQEVDLTSFKHLGRMCCDGDVRSAVGLPDPRFAPTGNGGGDSLCGSVLTPEAFAALPEVE